MSRPTTTPSAATKASSDSNLLTLVFLLPVIIAIIVPRAFPDAIDREFALALWFASHSVNAVFSLLSFVTLGAVSMNRRPDHTLAQIGDHGKTCAQLTTVCFLFNAYKCYNLATSPYSVETGGGSLSEEAWIKTTSLVVFNVIFGVVSWPLRLVNNIFVFVAMMASAGMIPALFL